MLMSAKRLGFKFHRNDENLSELQEDDTDDSYVHSKSTDSVSQTEGPQEATISSHGDAISSSAPGGSEGIPPQTRNLKNLSIKEFFTTRLMRTRSFESGNQSPSRDEATNWFEEFKAKMSKKSSSHSRSHHKCQTDDMAEDQFIDLSESLGRTAPQVGYDRDKQIPLTHNSFKGNTEEAIRGQLDESSTLTRESCAKCLGCDEKNIDHAKESRFLSLDTKPRRRKFRSTISLMEGDKPDFDTASINTILNRRDSRYNLHGKSHDDKKEFNNSRLGGSARNILESLFALDRNLPWKLLALFCLGLLCVLIALLSQATPMITFINGLIVGILSTLTCAAVIIICLILKMFPSRQDDNKIVLSVNTSFNGLNSNQSCNEPNYQDINEEYEEDSSTSSSPMTNTIDDCSQTNNDNDGLSEEETEEFKGWMIEFMGDYELRKTGDIKLQLIFVRLDGTILRLCKPKNNNDSNGSSNFPIFTQQRIYNLATVRKLNITLLLPKSIRNQEKWIWSKKYPLRLEFQESTNSSSKLLRFTLFVRSCREKEEWFQRFKKLIDRHKPQHDLSPLISLSTTTSSLNDLSADQEEIFSDCQTTTSRCNTPLTQSKSEIISATSNGPKKSLESKTKLPPSNTPSEASSLTDQPLDYSCTGLVRTRSCELISMKNLGSNKSDASIKKQQDRSTNDEQSDIPDPKLHKKPRHSADEASIRRSAEAINKDQLNGDNMGKDGKFTNRDNNRPNFNYKEFIERVIESGLDASPNSNWFNSLIGRMFFDVFSHVYWSVWFKRKIQRKLLRIRLPYFMETLTLTKIDLGTNAPQFRNVVSHNFDSFGLSIDFDMAYSGGLELTFETKLNLLKIKDGNVSSNTINNNNSSNNNNNNNNNTSTSSESKQQPSVSSDMNDSSSGNMNQTNNGNNSGLASNSSLRTSDEYSDTEESDSILSTDSSSDECDLDEISDWEDYGGERTRQTIVKFVDKIASSRYFQHATENKYIKKKLQDISNCPLVLVVQIQSLNGILTLNVPPPPTNRLWYGFRPNPDLVLRALPKMGDREVNLTHVTEWIERKLIEEFRKILVIPNMEDIVLPVLKTDSDRYITVVP